MATAGGPDIERDGLVFGMDTSYGIDTNNISSRFYSGEPTINNVGSLNSFDPLDLYTWVTSGHQMTISRDTSVTSPLGGTVIKAVTSGTSAYGSSYNTTSKNLAAASNGQTWTMSIYFKAPIGSTISMLLFEANSSGNYTTYSQQYITPTGKWQRFSMTRTLNQATTSYVQGRFDVYTSNVTVYYDGLQIEQNSKVTPFVNGTRSSTQSLIDLTKTSNIDVSNVSFDSTGQPTFDGTDDRISIPAGSFPTIGVNDFTVEVICKNTKTSSYNHFFSVKDQSHFALKMENAGSRRAYVYRTSGTSTYSAVPTYLTSTSNYYHLLVKREGDNLEMFLNGVSTGTKSGWDNLSIDNNAHTSYIGWGWGSEYTGGNIPLVKIYNRALSAQEVQQNYNAYKNRFNL